METQFKIILQEIYENDTNYDKRYSLVFSAMNYANLLGLKNYIKFDKNSPEWPIFCILLDDFGEISWHMPTKSNDSYKNDPYTTDEKYKRIFDYIKKQEIKKK